jgi:hypothetical protein
MITTRTMTRTSPIRVAYVRDRRTYSRLSVVSSIVACLALVVVFFFLSSAHQEAREQFMEKLKAEKQIVELNKSLKMEFAAITQKGYLEFAAKERLGLKRPTDEEVVVLR